MTRTAPRARGSRIAAKIAWRNARRHPGRSALIMALVALPTAALTAGGVLLASTMPTVDEQLTQHLGQAQSWVKVISPPDPTLRHDMTQPWNWHRATTGEEHTPTGFDPDDAWVEPADALPRGTRVLSVAEASATARTDTGLTAVTLVEGDVGDPTLAGRYDLVSGKVPARSTEVALSPEARDRMQARLGDTVTVTVDGRSHEVTIVGEMADRHRTHDTSVMFAPAGALTGATPLELIQRGEGAIMFYLPDLALTEQQVRHLNSQGMVAYSRALIENPPAGSTPPAASDSISQGHVGMVLAGGIAVVFQVCLLAGAAFVVGMRADQRSLAVVASVGGSPLLLSSIVSVGGIVLGAVGGIVGLGVGVLGAWVAYQALDDGTILTLPGFHPWPLPLFVALIIAVLSGWIAAQAAAHGARRINVVAALRGSRLTPAARPRRTVIGVSVAGAGAAVMVVGAILATKAFSPRFDQDLTNAALLTLAVGAILMQVGLILTVPLVLRAFARMMSPARGGARLAARDASRNHPRSTPVVAAVMTTVFASVLTMTFVASQEATTAASWVQEGPIGTVNVSLTSWDSPAPPTSDELSRIRDVVREVLGDPRVTVLNEVRDDFKIGQEEPLALTTVRADIPDGCWGATTTRGDCPSFVVHGWASQLTIGGVAELTTILGHAPSAETQASLNRGDAVALYPEFVHDGVVHLDNWSPDQADAISRTGTTGPRPVSTHTLPAVYEDTAANLAFGVIVPAATAERLGLEATPTRIIAAVDTAPSGTQLDTMWAALTDIRPGLWAQYESGPPRFGGGTAWALTLATLLVALTAAGVALGLARSDGRRDDEVLDAVGAPPLLRRSIAFWQAVTVTGVGALLGALVGILPVAILVAVSRLLAIGNPLIGSVPLAEFDAPWVQLSLVAVGIPLLIAAFAWLSTGRRRVAVRRTA